MASSVHSVEVAQGKVTIVGGFPDEAAPTWQALQTDRAYAEVMAGEDFMLDNVDVTGADPYAFTAPEVIDPTNLTGGVIFDVADGEPVRRMKVESVAMLLRVYAPEKGATFASVPFHTILESCCDFEQSAVVTTAVDAAGAHNGQFTVGVGDGTDFIVGAGVELVKNSIIFWAVVTDITGDQITVTPEFPVAVVNGDILRHCRTYTPRRGVTPDNKLLNVRFASAGIRQVGFDGVCTGFQIVTDADSGAVKLGATIRPNSTTMVRSGSGVVATYTPPTVRQVANIQSCRWKTPADMGVVAVPGHAVTSGEDMQDVTISVEMTGRAPLSCGSNIVLESAYDFSGRAETTLEYTTQNTAAYDTTMINGEAHQLVWGAGPPGQGLGLVFMANHLRTTETVGESDGLIETMAVSWRNGAWGGDTPTVNNLAGTGFRMLFPIPDP